MIIELEIMKLFGSCDDMKEVLQNANINIRIPKRLKNKFIEVTKEKEISYSYAIRKMISHYVNSGGTCEPFEGDNND